VAASHEEIAASTLEQAVIGPVVTAEAFVVVWEVDPAVVGAVVVAAGVVFGALPPPTTSPCFVQNDSRAAMLE
jgi:hypothetical protein